MDTPITEIARAIQEDRVVFVVGSGMSTSVGLPTSAELSIRLNEKFKIGLEAPECYDLQLVAKLVEIESGRDRLVEALRDILQFSGPSSEAHQLLVKIARKIVTTNYDTLIEEAVRFSGRPKRFKVIKRPTDCSNLTPPALIKAHGCITDKETLIITLNDYLERIAARDLLQTALKIWYSTNDLLLLGYSARDVDFLLSLHEIRKELGRFAGRAYAVVKDDNPQLRKVLESWNFQLIQRDVSSFLEELVDKWEARTEVQVSDVSLTVGGFKIDFGIVIGDVDKSSYRPDEIEVTWSDKEFQPPEQIASLVLEQWNRLLERADARKQDLWDGELARLCDYKSTRDKISLALQPTSYSCFATTNLLLDYPIVSRAEGEDRTIRELAGSDVFSPSSPYLANPLNVIAMLITADGFTFIPKRSATVYERPDTWQASVGGALKPDETPTSALIREVREEWGLDIKESEIQFLVLGINQRTGEPDLIAMVETEASLSQVIDTFSKFGEKFEFSNFETLRLVLRTLESFISSLRYEEWSQPSDQAALLLTLIRRLGMEAVENAFRRMGA